MLILAGVQRRRSRRRGEIKKSVEDQKIIVKVE